jgi:hypothetical protein
VAGTRKIPGPDGQLHDADPIGFRSSGEHFNEYLLDDGSVLKIKLVVTEVLKLTDMFDPLGNPVYLAMHSQVTTVDSPEELKGGGQSA